MIQVFHKIVTPSKHLQDFIKEYTFFDFVSDKDDTIPVKPFPANTEHCLVFYLKGFVTSIELATMSTSVFPKIAVNGSQLSRFNFHISNHFRLLSVQFQPGVLSKFLRLPLTDFTDLRIDAAAVLSTEIDQVYEEMIDTEDFDKIIGIIETYLWKRINNSQIDFHPIDTVARMMLENPTGMSLDKLAGYACLSISQFERRFMKQMGISPKLFLRINRFYKAYQLKEQNPGNDWLSIALHTGYYDYQHLVKDFQQFSYSTPQSLLIAQANAPEKLL
jgi:AraC-like DNA-binding protein